MKTLPIIASALAAAVAFAAPASAQMFSTGDSLYGHFYTTSDHQQGRATAGTNGSLALGYDQTTTGNAAARKLRGEVAPQRRRPEQPPRRRHESHRPLRTPPILAAARTPAGSSPAGVLFR